MQWHRSTIAGLWAVVAIAALDCLGVRHSEFLAGCWLVGAAIQVGLIAMLRSRGRSRHFWTGFETTGLGLLLAYAVFSQSCRRVVYRWAYWVTESIYDSMLGLPPDVFQWCFEHGLVIDPQRSLKVYEMVAVFEVAYGLPILLLAGVGGVLSAKLGSMRARCLFPTTS